MKMLCNIGMLALISFFWLSIPAVANAADAMPDGVIAISPHRLVWKDAQAYCESQGGRLPLFGAKKG